MGAERLWFYLRLYPYCVVRSIQAKMSYKSDFILGVTASILMQSLGFVFVWAIFQGIPEMNGWNFYKMVFVYGMSAAALGLNEFLFAGTWRVKMHIHQGTLDRILLRPVGTLFSVLTDDVGLHGLGSVLFGLAVCIVSFSRLHMALSLGKILFWTAAVVCGSLLFFAVNLICAALAFWVTDSTSVMILTQNISEFGKYPMVIYGRKLQMLLTYAVPFGFAGYYPSAFLLGMDNGLIYWLGPLAAAAVAVTAAGLFWKFALGRYQSAGG